MAGRVLWGLGEAVRAGAARAADAVSSAWAADASTKQLASYAVALRSAAAETEALGLWIEAGVARGGPRLARRAARRVTSSSKADEDGWAAARAPHADDHTGRMEADDAVLGPWGARAARLLEGPAIRRLVVVAGHAMGRGVCGAVASDLSVLVGVQAGAARSAVLFRP